MLGISFFGRAESIWMYAITNGFHSVCARVMLNIRVTVSWVDEIKPNQENAVLSAVLSMSQTETYYTATTIRASHNANHANRAIHSSHNFSRQLSLFSKLDCRKY